MVRRAHYGEAGLGGGGVRMGGQSKGIHLLAGCSTPAVCCAREHAGVKVGRREEGGGRGDGCVIKWGLGGR